MAQGTRFDRRALMSTAIGGALLPHAARGQTSNRAQQAMNAAVELSRLEATEHLPALYEFYARMHPDAQAIVPRHVVIGWYQDNWHPKGAHDAIATGLRFLDWTWGVNGTTYPGTAEVSFTQMFDNAPTLNDVVRLVERNGVWHWFFGRDRSWVDEQIAFYNSRAYIPQFGTVPFGLETVVNADPRIVWSLPVQIGPYRAEVVTDARTIPDYAAQMPFAIQYLQEFYPNGHALAIPINPGTSMSALIDDLVWDRVQEPPFTLRAWNLTPDNDVPFAWYEHFGSEAVGNAQTIIFGHASGDVLWTVSFTSDERLEELARSLVAIAQR